MKAIRIHKKYKPLYTSNSDLIIIYGSRGSAKSFTVADWACRVTFQKDEKILYTRYTLTSAKDSIIPEYKEKLELLNVENHFNITEHDITNKLTGSSIIFKGIKNSSGNQTANLKSIKDPTKWICDEAAEIPDYNTFQKIKRSLRKKGKKIQTILVLNPEDTTHWIYKMFFEAKAIPDYFNGIVDGVTYIHTTYIDNIENLSQEFIDDAEATKLKDLKEYECIFLGKWGNFLAERVFKSEKLKYFNLSEIDLKNSDGSFSFTDVANGGGDYFCTVYCEYINKKFYITNVICNKNGLIINEDVYYNFILDNKIIHNAIESNREGAYFSTKIMNKLNEHRKQNNNLNKFKVYPINSHTEKIQRIMIRASFILDNFVFRNDYVKGSDYDNYINNMTSFSTKEKNTNDDAPDATAGLAKFVSNYFSIK